MSIRRSMYLLLRGLVVDRARLAMECLALRQHVALLEGAKPRPKLRRRQWGQGHATGRTASVPRAVEPASQAKVVAIPHAGGLRYRCSRTA